MRGGKIRTIISYRIVYLGFGVSGIRRLRRNDVLISSILVYFSKQKAIADYLYEKTSKISRIIETTNVKIEKLKELCKTLINDVATCKLQVPQ